MNLVGYTHCLAHLPRTRFKTGAHPLNHELIRTLYLTSISISSALMQAASVETRYLPSSPLPRHPLPCPRSRHERDSNPRQHSLPSALASISVRLLHHTTMNMAHPISIPSSLPPSLSCLSRSSPPTPSSSPASSGPIPSPYPTSSIPPYTQTKSAVGSA